MVKISGPPHFSADESDGDIVEHVGWQAHDRDLAPIGDPRDDEPVGVYEWDDSDSADFDDDDDDDLEDGDEDLVDDDIEDEDDLG